MESLENVANKSPTPLISSNVSNIIYTPLFLSYIIGGAIGLASYSVDFVKNDNPSVGEQLLFMPVIASYIAGLPLLHFIFGKSVDAVNNFFVKDKK